MPSTKSIAIVTDSTADIPESLAREYAIHIVPNFMVIDGRGVEDGRGITREAFYSLLPKMDQVPTTATPASGTFEKLYAELLSGGAAQVVSLHAAGTLSGIYNAAHLAGSLFNDRVQVLDSGQLTLGLGFQVLAAAEAAIKGATIEKVLEAAKNVCTRVRVVAMLDTLEYVRRSGRVSWARARLGDFLSIKPFVEVKNGKVLSIGEARTRHKGIERLKRLLINQGPLERLAILHTNAESDARQIVEDLKQQLVLSVPPMVVNITTIIGVYTGPNGLGFASVQKS